MIAVEPAGQGTNTEHAGPALPFQWDDYLVAEENQPGNRDVAADAFWGAAHPRSFVDGEMQMANTNMALDELLLLPLGDLDFDWGVPPASQDQTWGNYNAGF